MNNNKTPTKTETHDIQIARLSILSDKRYFDAVIDMVTDISKEIGLRGDIATKLDEMLLEVLNKILEYGYEGDTTKSIDIILSKRAHSLVIQVEDRGLPFDYQKLEHGEDPRFRSFISSGYADQVHFINLGPSGNRVELVRELPSTDIREVADPGEHKSIQEAKEAIRDEKLSVRLMTPEEAIDMSRLVYRCYGYTYASDFVYYPEKVEAKERVGLMRSCAVYNSRGEMVGHLALAFESPGARIAESGQAVVDPRYRGHGIFEMMKNYMLDYASTNNVVGIYSEAVTVHPYSQKGNLALGAHEVGFLLGYSPGTVSFHSISDNERPRRQSISLMYMTVLKTPSTTVYAPEVYGSIIEKIYDITGIKRSIKTDQINPLDSLTTQGKTRVSVRPDHNQAFMIVETCGRNSFEEIRFHLKQFTLHRYDCIYVDLPLSQGGTGTLGTNLRDIGFFFGGVIPELREGDILRLQYLNNVEISTEDIAVASDFGKTLLEVITQDRNASTR